MNTPDMNLFSNFPNLSLFVYVVVWLDPLVPSCLYLYCPHFCSRQVDQHLAVGERGDRDLCVKNLWDRKKMFLQFITIFIFCQIFQGWWSVDRSWTKCSPARHFIYTIQRTKLELEKKCFFNFSHNFTLFLLTFNVN